MDEKVSGARSSAEEKAFEARDAGDRDIGLPRGKGSLGEIHEDLLEGAPLRAMYGDGPAEEKGKLAVLIGDFLRELSRAEDELDFPPYVGLYGEFAFFVPKRDAILFQACDRREASVAVAAPRIVDREEDARADLELEDARRGQLLVLGLLREMSAGLGRIAARRARQCVLPVAVQPLRLVIPRGQDKEIGGWLFALDEDSGLEKIEVRLGDLSRSAAIEGGEKVLFVLAEDPRELDSANLAGSRAKDLGRKEKRTLVAFVEELADIAVRVGLDGRKLIGVAEKHEARAAEGEARLVLRHSHPPIHFIEQVRADHGVWSGGLVERN